MDSSDPTIPSTSEADRATLSDDGSYDSNMLHRLRPEFEQPKQIGPYHILERIGGGGMGEVFKAERRVPMRQLVAIKIIKLGFDSQEVLARFESERQALARMDHPHIAKVLDAGSTDTGRSYFVMEYVAGVPINKFCDDNKLTIKDRLLLFVQVCEAIAHAHTKAIIHRDIKAANVVAYLRDGKPTAKVIDFGIAKALTADRLTDATFNTELGHVIGTYETMSPEQADGSPDIDTRTDVYSLGVLLYELLAGTMPFDHDSLAHAAENEIKRIIREVEPPRPSTKLTSLGGTATRIASLRRAQLDVLCKELRSELEWIPLKAMRKERDRRYSSAQQLADDIENYLQHRPLVAGPESQVYRLRKFAKRHRASLAAAAIVLLGVTFGVVQLSRAEQQAARARSAEQARLQAEAREAKLKEQLEAALANSESVIANARQKLNLSNDSALSEIEKGKVEGAEQQLRLAYAKAEQQLGPNDPLALRLMHNLAITLQLQGKERYPEAEALFREALRRRRQKLGPTDGETLYSVNSLGVLLRAQKQYSQAEPLFREALEVRQQQFGPDDEQTIQSAHDLGSVLRLEEKFSDAEPLLRSALDWRRHNLREGHPHTLDSLYSYGLLLQQTSRISEALPLFRELFELAPRETIPARQIAVYTSCYGVALAMSGRFAEAEPVLLEAQRRLVDAQQQRHPSYRSVVESLVTAYQSLGKPDAAGKWKTVLQEIPAPPKG